MKDSKDIFDLFKDNEDKLNQRPTDRAWDRLEGRLDNHKQNSQAPQRAPRLIRKWLSMTGVLLVLVLAISGLSNLFQNKPTATAMNQRPVSPQFVLEEIGLYSDQNNTRKDIDLYRTQLNRLNTNPILEGDPSKELRIQQKVFITMQIENEKKAKAENTNQKPRQIAANKKVAKSSESVKADAIVSKDEKEMLATAPTASTMSTIEKPDDFNARYSAEAATEVNADIAVMDEITVASAPTEMMKESNVTSYENGSSLSVNQLDISNLNWLLGQWDSPSYNNSTTETGEAKSSKTENQNKAQSFEKWTQTNANTISGQGFILDNGEKTPMESMQITEIENELYYILNIGKQAPLRYKLKSCTPEKIIFENSELPFPNQVILQRSEDGRSFWTIFQNDTSLQLNEELREYFERRNEISSEQIKRVMTKKQ
ncbi:MAG: hypothetical protein ACI9XB_000337 [Gammaproteobacteria bacterium]|jgi:hypothetical protein